LALKTVAKGHPLRPRISAAPQLRGRLLTTIDAITAYRDVPGCAPLADAPVAPECMANATLRSSVRIEFDLAIRTTALD
jgi:hypothetical protein